MADTPEPTCTTCHKTQTTLGKPLQRCARCSTTRYCSRECQKDDWKKHKRSCGSASASGSASRDTSSSQSQGQHNPGFDAINTFLGGADYLASLAEKDVYYRLIDCFRMRCEYEYAFSGNNMGIYGGGDPLEEFQDFLGMAESRAGLLPAWWNEKKRVECEKVALQPITGPRKAEGNIYQATEKKDIQEYYGNSLMPMQLRVLGEKNYGRGFM